mmetsp:Transcript_7276/g.15902  ORF Transcript_7276/g.15902 Transcript_7276/m.15902 type:complete len:684 (-) Transcript_7276:68-2119(-)
MKVVVAVLTFLLLGCHAADARAVASGEQAASKNRPVSKVITLLRDMLKQLEKDAEEDEEVYEKLACWCETNDKEKSKSIAAAEATIADLTSKIEELTAASAQLGTEIKNFEAEVAKNQGALEKATALRQKQLAEFNAEEKDLLQSISSLKAAVVVLSKHHEESLLQFGEQHTAKVAGAMKQALDRHGSLLQGALTPAQRRLMDSFLQNSAQPYQAQSGQIFGILRQMLETFQANLADSQKEEAENAQAFEELKTAKKEEIEAGQDQLDAKTQEKATTDEKLAQAKVDLKDTKGSLTADQAFLSMLKEKCQMTDQEWEERQKTRQAEMDAVSKALAVLSSDDAHDLFTRTFNPSFLQESSENSRAHSVASASAVLSAAAKKFNNPRLAALATRVRLDAFSKVKAAIDAMVTQLLKEKKDEIDHKDWCVEEFNTNQLQTEKKERAKEDILSKIEDLEMTMKELTKAIEVTKSEIEEMQVQLKRAGEDREKENKEFQATVADQRETAKLLKAALNMLKEFYAPAGSAFAQRSSQAPAGPPPPPGFDEYKKSSGSTGVMGMMQQIIDDTKAMEKEAIRDEEDAQKAYEDFVKQTNASVEAKSKEIVQKSEVKAKTEAELVEANKDKDSIITELEQLSNYKAELHSSCDFILKNFEERQTSRDEEVEALKQAKAILSGAKFEDFLQTA